MEIQAINIAEKNPLFADYLANSAKIQEFYPFHFKNDWQAAIAQRSRFEVPRMEVAEILSARNQKWGASAETLDNIKRLNSAKTLTVVTGQQAGILGGPLYTFFKTMTVLKLAEKLKNDYPGYNFVPLFWMEVNDSDFKEISAIQYISKENELKRLAVEENPDDALKPVFARQVDGQIRQWRQIFAEDFFDTEFKEDALNTFLESYSGDQNYGDAFARLLLKFFGKYGLVVMDPSDPAISALAKPLFAEGLNSAKEILDKFEERRETIENAGYTPQIQFSANQTMLFFNDAQLRRVRVDFDEAGQFLLKYPEGYQPIPREELLENGSGTPQSLSPNVALRPLMQDSLLPTVAYVAGPAEVAYFAQVETLYRHFDIPMPVIYPRHRLTIAEGKIQKNMQKFNLEYADILAQRPDFVEMFVRQNTGQELYGAVESAEGQIMQALESLHKHIAEADPTLLNTLKKTQQNIEGGFRSLSVKITRSLEQKSQTQVQQLEKVLLHLLPGSSYQERTLNMVYFCIKYGTGFVDDLYRILPGETDKHYIVKM